MQIPAMSNMRAPGHTVLIALKQELGGFYRVTLECSCGRIFAEKNALPSEQEAAKSLVLSDGSEGANAHIARIHEAVKTLKAGQPCAA
jgi:hypothetical protein